jgi:SAM-dependent methyltransferase
MLESRKLSLYEASVQDAPGEASRIAAIYRKQYGREARDLAEDFCGSFWLGYEWVRRGKRNQAWGLDLDSKVIQAGRERHASRLGEDVLKRAHPRKGNVLSASHPPVDIVMAGNFSYFTLRQRALLLRYFRHCRQRLKTKGVLVLDHFGGPDCLKPNVERRKIKGEGGESFTYVWQQHGYSHVTGEADFSIHFRTRKEGFVRDAFVYNWRLWSLPELRDLLMEAGFKGVDVYWDFDKGFRKTLYGEDEVLSSVSYLVAFK